MVLLQLVAVAAGTFWVAAGIVLLARGPRRRRVLGGAAVVVGAVLLAAVALWILAQTPLTSPRPEGTGFPPLP